MKMRCSSPILLGRFDKFAPKNFQAFSEYEVTNVNSHTEYKSNLLRKSVYASFMNELEVDSIFKSSRKLNYKFKFLHVCTQKFSIKCLVSNFVF